LAGGNGHRTVIGTPADIADAMEEGSITMQADGFQHSAALAARRAEDSSTWWCRMQRRGLTAPPTKATPCARIRIPYAAFGKVALDRRGMTRPTRCALGFADC